MLTHTNHMTKSSQNSEGGACQRLLLRIPRCGHKRLRENATLLNLKILSQPLFRSLEQEKERNYEDRKVLLTQTYLPQLGHRIHWSDHDDAVILTKIRVLSPRLQGFTVSFIILTCSLRHTWLIITSASRSSKPGLLSVQPELP